MRCTFSTIPTLFSTFLHFYPKSRAPRRILLRIRGSGMVVFYETGTFQKASLAIILASILIKGDTHMASVKKIVSVQDISCYGQCSLTVALPILSAYGVETAILPSAILSTHTGGFPHFTCLDLTDEMPKIIDSWKKEGLRFDAIYTGYIGDARQFAIIASMRNLLNDGALLIVDPAMADHGKLYAALDETIVDGMRELVKTADVILPNLTEAAFLLNREYKENYSREETEELLRALADLGPRYAILTGVNYEPGKIGAACYDKETGKITTYLSDRAPNSYHGTGDIFSSVVVAGIVNEKGIAASLREACEFTRQAILDTIGDPTHPYGVHFEKTLQDKMLHSSQD